MTIFINLGKLNIPSNLFDADEEDHLEIEIPTADCICEIGTLLSKGCRCGAMQIELAGQPKSD